jgi:uncharacterized protein YkwD
VLRLANQERKAAGCPALKSNTTLVSVARAHSTDMAIKGYFDHASQDGRSPFQRMAAAGYAYSMAAENIAYGQPSAAAVMTAWMNSAGHRANILNCSLTELGVGAYRASASSPIYWTQDFGTPR